MTARAPAPIRYRVEAASLQAHLYRVTLTVDLPDAAPVVSLPAWIPGRHPLREVSTHLQPPSAHQNAHPNPPGP